MIVYVYYPHVPRFFFTVLIDRDMTVYWQASQIFGLQGWNRDIRRVLRAHLQYDRIRRCRDVASSPGSNAYLLTSEQVRRLLSRVRHADRQFEAWFEDVESGRQVLRPRNHVKYQYCTATRPFARTGFAADCSETTEEHSFTLPDLLLKVEEYLAGSKTPPPAMAAAAIAPTGATPPPRLLVVEKEEEPTFSEQQQEEEEDPFRMEIDETKNFVLKDSEFGSEYKFYAVHANWLSGTASVGFSPFYMPDGDRSFLYIPVKKH